ncbi:MAG: exodeoxyribonuclease V subunit gamma, partial [Actinomycetota bacterium]|nr:exodeoxyribonuclease V subunit gamma [Actinomycetota bacterium]
MPLDPGFFLHRSNRTEQLLEALVDVVATPATDDPLAAECIVVQGQGMGRWLSMSLAAELGVWARPEFPFVRRLLDDCAETVLGAGSGPDVYEGDTLVLAVARELDRFAGDPDFAPVTEYVGDDPGGGRRIQLSERIAQTLDSYTVHRPRLLEQWQRGGGRAPDGSDHRDARWQSKLWRALGEGAECVSPDRRWRALAERLRAEAPPAGALPPRISIFGLSALPPIFVDTFSAIAMHVPVHLFLLTPTREYWADLKSRKAVWREQVASGGALARDEAEVAALEGHPLLASFGRLGRDFQTIFEAQVDYLEDPVERFVDPTEQGVGGADESTVLSRIQARMLRLESPPAGGTARVDPTRDDSIRLHVCHSPLREIEVLHDQLIDLFERDPTLEPKDVVVMSPDIERHAPLVEAVFGVRSALGAGRIPHRIADRSIVVTREGVAAFLRLVEVASGRCGASQVLDVLSLPSVRERYGLDASDVARLEAWVAEAGVRWGLDGEHRAAEGLPDDDTHTWRFGLDRLLLGVAMDPAGDALFEGRRPMRDVEADDLRRVGALSAFVADLEWGHRSLQGQRPLDGWARVFEELVARCIVRRDDNAHHHQALRQSFAALVDCAESAAFEGELSLSAAHSLLLRSLRASTPAYGFLSGGVTFCEMVPMRSIPFRVVCLIGLDDGAFPRVRRPFGFDLAPLLPMVGDRSPREVEAER